MVHSTNHKVQSLSKKKMACILGSNVNETNLINFAHSRGLRPSKRVRKALLYRPLHLLHECSPPSFLRSTISNEAVMKGAVHIQVPDLLVVIVCRRLERHTKVLDKSLCHASSTVSCPLTHVESICNVHDIEVHRPYGDLLNLDSIARRRAS
jgi:hypothetical protein